MKALAWGVNFVAIAVVAMAVQGCGYRLVKQQDILARDFQISDLKAANDKAAAEARTAQATADALQKDLKDRDDAIEQMKGNMGTLSTALTQKLELQKAVRDLTDKLSGQIGSSGGASVERVAGGVLIRIPGDIVFSAGKVDIRDEAGKTLTRIADALKKEKGDIEVSGFTDSDPIVHSAWKTNMRLSGERAMAVMDYLAEKGIPAERMHYAGYGEYKTVKDEGGAENKKASRRVEILLMTPAAGDAAMPAAPASAPKKATTPEKKGPPEK